MRTARLSRTSLVHCGCSIVCIARASLESSVGCYGAGNCVCVYRGLRSMRIPFAAVSMTLDFRMTSNPGCSLNRYLRQSIHDHRVPRQSRASQHKKQLTRDWGSAYTEDCGGVHTAETVEHSSQGRRCRKPRTAVEGAPTLPLPPDRTCPCPSTGAVHR